MRRRDLITLFGDAAAASSIFWPLSLNAQQPDRTRRIGVSVPFSENHLASTAFLSITRAQIVTTTMQVPTFVVSGYATAGDNGAGAIYTNQGASSLGLGAIQDASGTWFRLVCNGSLNAGWFGAVGDGLADDTTSLQNAINAGLAFGYSLFIPRGQYSISAPLTVGDGSPHNNLGFRIIGDGKTDFQGLRSNGTLIQMTSASQTSVVSVNANGGWRYFEMEELTLTCTNTLHPHYGLLFSSTEFSQATVRRVRISLVGICIGVLTGTGENGEFNLYEDCTLAGDNGVFYINATEAYNHTFRNCVVGASKSKAIWFNLDSSVGGLGLQILDCNGTGGVTNGIANSTFIRNTTSSSPVNVIGGRYENITKLLDHGNEGTPNLTVPTNFRFVQVECDYDPTNIYNTTDGFISVQTNRAIVTIEDCAFGGSGGSNRNVAPILWNTGGNGQAALLRMKGNIWANFASVYIVAGERSYSSGIEIDDFLQIAGGTQAVSNHSTALTISQLTAGKRRSWSQSARSPSGYPSNIIVAPQITSDNGTTVSPASPWSLTGASNIAAYDTTQAGNSRPTSQSPYAKRIKLAAGATLSQVLSALDLSSSTHAFGFEGTNIITWQIMLAMPSHATCRFSITGSTTGRLFDQIVFNYGVGSSIEPVVITLSREIVITELSEYPVINIVNTDSSNSLTLDIWWQYASFYPDPAWSDSTSAGNIYGRSYDLVSPTALISSQLGLPSIPDAMRLTNANFAPEVPAEIFESATQHRMVERTSDGMWWVRPRATTGLAAPTTGTWARGDLVWNTAPSAGGKVGWVCTASGTPGTWKTFGVISP